MSLDVRLEGPPERRTEIHTCCDCEHQHEFTQHVVPELFHANVTHNLVPMAKEAGLYQALWRPDEAAPPLTHAKHLIPLLEAGLDAMRENPAKFEALAPSNGWGTYAAFVPWVGRYLRACREFPDATIRVFR